MLPLNNSKHAGFVNSLVTRLETLDTIGEERMNPPFHNHGKECRVELRQLNRAAEPSEWFNTYADLQAHMQLIRRADDATYIAHQRSVLCDGCRLDDNPIEDVGEL